VYDVARYEETEEMRSFENTETLRQQDLSLRFEQVFLGGAFGDDHSVVEESDDLVEIERGEEN